MKKLLAFLFSMFTLASCQNDQLPAKNSPDDSARAEISYEPNEPNTDDAGARTGTNADASAISQSIAFQSITNDLTFAQAYTVKFWSFGVIEPSQSSRFDISPINQLRSDAINYPSATLTKSNLRLFTSKSLKAGWYLAQGTGSQVVYKFQVTKGQAGLLTIQDENNPALIDGYKPGFGKLKVSLWNKGGQQVTEAGVYFGPTYSDQDTQRFINDADQVHLFARDGVGASKYQTFCLPEGTYRFAYRNAIGAIVSAQADITPGQTVHLKLVF